MKLDSVQRCCALEMLHADETAPPSKKELKKAAKAAHRAACKAAERAARPAAPLPAPDKELLKLRAVGRHVSGAETRVVNSTQSFQCV